MPDNNEMLAQTLEEVKGLTKTALEDHKKALADERKAYEEMVAAKADGKAFAELKEIVEKQEKAYDELKAAYDKEIAELKMSATTTQVASEEEEIKQAFFDVIRTGSDKVLPEAKRLLLPNLMLKQFHARGDTQKTLDEVKSMIAGVDSTGGILLLPPTLDRAIKKYMDDSSDLYRIASHTTIGSASYTQASVTEDADGVWIGETEEHKETTGMRFGSIEIPVHQIMASPSISRILVEDAMIDMEAEIMQSAQRTFSRRISHASINGDGVKRLKGILQYKMAKQTKSESSWGFIGYVPSGKADGFVESAATGGPIDSFMDVQGLLGTYYQPSAGWLVNRATGTVMRKFKNKDGDYLWEPNSKMGEPPMFLGAPVYFDYNMPDVAAGSVPVLYGDFGQGYKFVHRRGIQVTRDLVTKKGFVVINMDMRLGGGVCDFNAIKALKISAN